MVPSESLLNPRRGVFPSGCPVFLQALHRFVGEEDHVLPESEAAIFWKTSKNFCWAFGGREGVSLLEVSSFEPNSVPRATQVQSLHNTVDAQLITEEPTVDTVAGALLVRFQALDVVDTRAVQKGRQTLQGRLEGPQNGPGTPSRRSLVPAVGGQGQD